MAGFLGWLFKRPGSEPEVLPPRLVQGGLFDVVGEASYQDALTRICGGKGEFSAEHQCKATLIPEPTNPEDANAVQVIIDRKLVGYLTREHAIEYRQHIGAKATSCDAKIVGGWKDAQGEGNFGVKLKVKWPPRFAKTK